MIQTSSRSSRRLWLSVSVLAIMGGGAASAQTAVLTPTSPSYDIASSTDKIVEISSGTNVYLNRGGMDWAIPANTVSLIASGGISGIGSCTFSWDCAKTNAPIITVDRGATLTLTGTQWQSWYNGGGTFESVMNASGDLVLQAGGTWQFMGSNSLLGNVTVLDGAKMKLGESWWSGTYATTTFGANTNIDLQGTSSLEIWDKGTTLQMGRLSGSAAALVDLKAGALTINGQNTSAMPFAGTINVATDQSLVVGDAMHTSAVLGDPTHNAAKINLTGTTSTLAGYGTIDGSVVNNGIVRAGGTKNVSGNLTINGSYTQASTGQLYVGITPTGVSGLIVNGNANIGGDLIISIAEGTYGNAVNPLLAVNNGTLSGSFSTVSTNGNVTGAMVGVAKTASGYFIVTANGTASQVFGHLVYANRTALTNFVGSLYDVMAITPATGAKVDTWITPIGQIENLGRDGLGYEQKTYGLRMGAMHRFESHGGVVGAAFSYRHGNMSVKDDPATASTNGYDFAVYGGADVNELRFEGAAFYNVYDAATKRPLGTYGTTAADHNGYSFGASGQISHDMFASRLTPYLRGMYSRTHLGAASESGSDYYNLRHDGLSANTFAVDLGTRVHLLRTQPEQRIKVDVDVAWRYDLSDPGETVTGGFVSTPDSSSAVFWKGDSKNAFRAGVNVAGQVTDELEIYGRLDGTVTSYRRAGELAAGVKYRF